MKKSELRQMIKEEYTNIITEYTPSGKNTLKMICGTLKKAGFEVIIKGSLMIIDPKSGGEPPIELQISKL